MRICAISHAFKDIVSFVFLLFCFYFQFRLNDHRGHEVILCQYADVFSVQKPLSLPADYRKDICNVLTF